MHTPACRSLVSLTVLVAVSLAATGLAAEPTADAFVKTVSAMQPEQQVQAVIAKLKELNPNFDGKETHKIENGAVTTLSFSSVGVTDISPVKALRWLRTLSITPPALNQKGSLENLAPLQGMQLTWLWCHNNPITDLTPLKGMPLTVLSLSGTQVNDLSPLIGMTLQVLSFNDTVVANIAPLEGMPLTVLWCNNTKVADLTSLKAVPLQELKCDQPVAAQNAATLRGIRTLTKINDLPTPMFWARVSPVTASNVGGTSASRPTATTPEQGRGTKAAPTLEPAATGGVSAKEQIRRFVEKMKELNPEFDGNVDYTAEGNKVVELSFSTEAVTNIRPVQAQVNLRKLVCAGPLRPTSSPLRPGVLPDISPLKGLRLKELDCRNNTITDLGPLAGMTLITLQFAHNPVADLSPLKGMRLESLNGEQTKISDLLPLKGMMLSKLNCARTQVSDLSPLKGMRLRILYCNSLKIADLSVLRGMPLIVLYIPGTQVTDLSMVKEMPIQSLGCDFVPDRDTKLLRSIKTLEKINNVPVKEFWKRVDAGDVPHVR
jgi:Leucine-rich repeat (LRR) protein